MRYASVIDNSKAENDRREEDYTSYSVTTYPIFCRPGWIKKLGSLRSAHISIGAQQRQNLP
jgi:hypothetical protein